MRFIIYIFILCLSYLISVDAMSAKKTTVTESCGLDYPVNFPCMQSGHLINMVTDIGANKDKLAEVLALLNIKAMTSIIYQEQLASVVKKLAKEATAKGWKVCGQEIGKEPWGDTYRFMFNRNKQSVAVSIYNGNGKTMIQVMEKIESACS